jgi:TetR/AcrR family transcriptional regulator, regulator of autoinduction and epiphytic fitness
MPGDVNPKRPYRSTARERQRASTRAGVVDAAHRLFVERGYAATTIAAIAEDAAVSPESVYAIFGNKRELLRCVVESLATDGGTTTGVIGDDLLEQIRAEPDQRRRFALMTDATRDVLRRVAPIDEVVRAAAVSDPEIAEMQREHGDARLRDVRRLVGLLADAGPLRMPRREAADVMWSLSLSTDFYRALTAERGWGHERAFSALNDVLVRTLFPGD